MQVNGIQLVVDRYHPNLQLDNDVAAANRLSTSPIRVLSGITGLRLFRMAHYFYLGEYLTNSIILWSILLLVLSSMNAVYASLITIMRPRHHVPSVAALVDLSYQHGVEWTSPIFTSLFNINSELCVSLVWVACITSHVLTVAARKYVPQLSCRPVINRVNIVHHWLRALSSALGNQYYYVPSAAQRICSQMFQSMQNFQLPIPAGIQYLPGEQRVQPVANTVEPLQECRDVLEGQRIGRFAHHVSMMLRAEGFGSAGLDTADTRRAAHLRACDLMRTRDVRTCDIARNAPLAVAMAFVPLPEEVLARQFERLVEVLDRKQEMKADWMDLRNPGGAGAPGSPNL